MSDFSLKYYRDSYLKEYESTVVSCQKTADCYQIVLNDTIFYPEGGGQKADRGTINGIEVTDVREKDGIVIHYCNEGLNPGEKAKCVIDWRWRYDNMQNHSGEHLVSGLIHKHYGYDNVGFHMGEFIQIDFNGPLSWQQVLEIEKEANQLIDDNLKINELFPQDGSQVDYRSKKELSGQIRLIEIPSADLCACCGTHVRSTSEIGCIGILSLMKHKKGVRLEMLAGNRLRNYLSDIYEENRKISSLLSAPAEKTAEYVEALLKRNHQLQSDLAEVKETLLFSRIAGLPEKESVCVQFTSEMDRITCTKYANALLRENKGRVVAVINQKGNLHEYLLISNDIDLRGSVRELNEKLNGRGGGRSDNIQGSFNSDRDTIEKTLQEMFEEERQG